MINLYSEKRYQDGINSFKKIFDEEVHSVYSSPGRSELCGNHVDHNGGKAVCASIDLDMLAFVSLRRDTSIHVFSEGSESFSVDTAQLKQNENERFTSKAIVAGVLKGFDINGFAVGGFNCYVTSQIPQGAGLSSSASFEILIGTILNHLYNDAKLSPISISKIAKYSENEYYGKPCGILDQLGCNIGGILSIDFSNQQEPQYEKIDFDFSRIGHLMCITDVKADHSDLSSEYESIRNEMKLVASFFGKDMLCKVSYDDFKSSINRLLSLNNHRAILRAMHFFEENIRSEKLASALKTNDFSSFLEVIKSSGASSFMYLQNIHSEKSHLIQPVSLALSVSSMLLNGSGASRVHGGGFGGTIQSYVPIDMAEHYKREMEKVFGNDSCHVISIRNEGGIRVDV